MMLIAGYTHTNITVPYCIEIDHSFTIFASWVKSLVKKAPLARQFCKTKRFVVFYVFLRDIACFAEKQRKSKDRRNLGPQGTTRRSKQNQSLMKNDRTCKKGETIVGSYTLMGKGTKYSSSAKRENSDWVIHEIENDWAGGEKKQWNSETVKQRNSETVKQWNSGIFAYFLPGFAAVLPNRTTRP